jgi:hypothetical protein
MSDPGTTFAQAFAAKDTEGLRALLAPELDFRAMTPGRFWEATSVDEVLDVLLANWVETSDEVVALEHVAVGTVSTRPHVTYRMRLRNPDGEFLMEQRAYFETEAKQIRWMRVMCSGFVRVQT